MADFTPPSSITNLSTSNPTSSSITLNWTSPGDDGNIGTASAYDIRYSIDIITDINWDSAIQATSEPLPAVAGTFQSMIITNLFPNAVYYFAMKTFDEVPNVSGISNVVSGTTAGDTMPPSPPQNVSVI